MRAQRHIECNADIINEPLNTSLTRSKRILVVNDDENDRRTIEEILGKEYELIFASRGDLAIEVFENSAEAVRLILLDLRRRPMDSYDFLEKCKKHEGLMHIPVIMTVDSVAERNEIKALESGAMGIITKPYNPNLLLHRVCSIISLHDSVSIIKTMECDRLTGLYTKDYFYRKVRAVLASNPDTHYDIICSDIEKFKLINDLFGVSQGDRILCEVAKAVQFLAGPDGICARLGSDTFAAFVEHRSDFGQEDCLKAAAYVNSLSMPANIVLKFGLYNIEDRTILVSMMCDRAILAIQSIKDRYGVALAVYDDSIRRKLIMEQSLVEGMEAALEENQFVLHFQPKYNIHNDKIAGAEALVRWQHPEHGLIYPDMFIPLFERNGFIYRLDRYVWEASCALLRKWKDMGLDSVPISVNVSRNDLYKSNLPDILLETVRKYGIEPRDLHLEITESAYTNNPKQIIDVVTALRERGFIIEMDDFGTGYSSLNMLSELPIDVLKLDISFIQNESETSSHKNIFTFIISLAKWLDLLVIAEGVETLEQVDKLRSMDCDYVQGYYFSRPVPEEDYLRMLRESDIDDSGDLVSQVDNPLNTEIVLTQRNNSKQIVLIVDDSDENRAELIKIIKPHYSVAEANNGVSALKYIKKCGKEIVAVILDMDMPVMDGRKFMSIMKNDDRLNSIPIIVVGEAGNTGEEEALEMGADDFIMNPYKKKLVLHHVRNSIDSAALRIQQRYLDSKHKLQQGAYTDYLTGLLNKRGLEEAWANMPDFCLDIFSLIMIDIDNFRDYNNSFGREAGDEILKTFSRSLVARLRSDDIIARTGGDEFVIITQDMVSPENALKKARQLCESAAVPCSVGVVVFDKKPLFLEEASMKAEKAVCCAKQNGKNGGCIWTSE